MENRPDRRPLARVYRQYFEPGSNDPIPAETLRRHENQVNGSNNLKQFYKPHRD